MTWSRTKVRVKIKITVRNRNRAHWQGGWNGIMGKLEGIVAAAEPRGICFFNLFSVGFLLVLLRSCRGKMYMVGFGKDLIINMSCGGRRFQLRKGVKRKSSFTSTLCLLDENEKQNGFNLKFVKSWNGYNGEWWVTSLLYVYKMCDTYMKQRMQKEMNFNYST